MNNNKSELENNVLEMQVKIAQFAKDMEQQALGINQLQEENGQLRAAMRDLVDAVANDLRHPDDDEEWTWTKQLASALKQAQKVLNTLKLSDIRYLSPNVDLACCLPEDWKGTVVDILQSERIHEEDRVYIALQIVDPRIATAFQAKNKNKDGGAKKGKGSVSYTAYDSAWGVAWCAAYEKRTRSIWKKCDWDSYDPAWDAAWRAAWDEQISMLIGLIGKMR